MGKQSKRHAAEKRKSEKAKKKVAKIAQYAAWTEAGTNSKSTRARERNRKSKQTKLRTRNPEAVNVGDAQARPTLNVPFLARLLGLKHGGMPHQFTGRSAKLVQATISTDPEMLGVYLAGQQHAVNFLQER